MIPVTTKYGTTYKLTAEERAWWLQHNRSNPVLAQYLRTLQPQHGVIVDVTIAPGLPADQFLVWYDASKNLHVIKVTGTQLAVEVRKADFESPNSSFVENLMDELQKFAGGARSALMLGVAVVAGLFLLKR